MLFCCRTAVQGGGRGAPLQRGSRRGGRGAGPFNRGPHGQPPPPPPGGRDPQRQHARGPPPASPIPVKPPPAEREERRQQQQPEAQQQEAGSEGAAGSGGAGSFGRSPPGRSFISANFLLNFQSSRPGAQVWLIGLGRGVVSLPSFEWARVFMEGAASPIPERCC